MFTRCPQCKTVHPLNAALISHARGLVQCGQCSRSFSALSFLFDEWPSGEAHRPASGPDATLPILGPIGKDDTESDDTSSDGDEPDPSGVEPRQLAWILATGLLECQDSIPLQARLLVRQRFATRQDFRASYSQASSPWIRH